MPARPKPLRQSWPMSRHLGHGEPFGVAVRPIGLHPSSAPEGRPIAQLPVQASEDLAYGAGLVTRARRLDSNRKSGQPPAKETLSFILLILPLKLTLG